MTIGVGCSFQFYLVNFYIKYLPGDFFTNQMCNSLAEAGAQFITLTLIRYMSVKKGLVISFFITGVSCLIVMISESLEFEHLIPIAVFGVKAGVSVAFGYFYFSTINYFRS